MRILITGNKGFIGKYTEELLAASGFQVEGYDLADGCDILDAELLAGKMKGCQAVVHLAAIEDPSPTRTMQTNLLGTWNVLCASREAVVERVIFLSSVDALGVFQGEGKPLYLPLDDEYPCHPNAPYSLSKKLAEEMCRHFSAASGTAVTCLRPPGVWDEATYEMITAARRERPEYEWDPFWEYGAFLDVRDLAEAVLLALRSPLEGFHCLLLASDDITTSGLSSLELVRKLHPDVQWRGGAEYEADPFRSLVDTREAKRVLNWSPKHSWRQYREGLAVS